MQIGSVRCEGCTRGGGGGGGSGVCMCVCWREKGREMSQ
jgi:hypothetical protein